MLIVWVIFNIHFIRGCIIDDAEVSLQDEKTAQTEKFQ